MASVFNPLGQRRGKNKKRPLVLAWSNWETLCHDSAALQALLHKGYGPNDVLEQYTAAFQQGGAFAAHGAAARQLALAFLKRHGVALCRDVPVDVVRKLYEVVSEQAARPIEDGVHGASRMQMLALDALTVLLIGLRVHESDPRLLKVHVQRLYRDLDPRTPIAAGPSFDRASSSGSGLGLGAAGGSGSGGSGVLPAPVVVGALHHRVAASDCLRAIELAFPGMLLAGGGRLLELSLAEAESATPAATQLAVAVLSHGAARYLSQQAAAAAAAAHAPSATGHHAAGSRLGSFPAESYSDRFSSSCTSPHATTTDGYSSDHEGALLRPASPVHTDGEEGSKGAGHGRHSAASGGPPSPCAVASHAARYAQSAATSGSNSSLVGSGAAPPLPPLAEVADAAADAGSGTDAAAPGAAGAAAGGAAGSGSMQRSNSLAERVTSNALPLLSKSGPGLRHFYVPEYFKGPGAQGLEGCQLVLTPEAEQRLQEAVPHFLRLLPRVVPEDLHQMAALLAPLLRVARCPQEALQPLLERHLRSHSLPLMQAVLMLLDELPSVYEPWEDVLFDQLFRILVGRSPSDQRMAVLSWLLRRHHQQRYCKEPSLFVANWRAVLPASQDDVLLLTLKIKALTACIASGIGDVWEMAEAVNAWDGFWEPAPSPQHLRAAAYTLRMLCFAECQPAGPSNEHRLKAIVVSVVVQMVATRPQYLSAVESFMQHCGPAVRAAILAAVNVLLVAAAPPMAAVRQGFSSRRQLLAVPEQSSVSSLVSSSSDRGGTRMAPSEHSVQHSSMHGRSTPSETGSIASGIGSEGGAAGPTRLEDSESDGETAATQGADSDARGSSRLPSAVASPEPPQHSHSHSHRHLRHHSSRRRHHHQHGHDHDHPAAPLPPFSGAAAGEFGHSQPSSSPRQPPPILTRTTSPIPTPGRQPEPHAQPAAETPLSSSGRRDSQPFSARLSSSLPAVFSRFLSQGADLAGQPAQQQPQVAAQQGVQQPRDPALRRLQREAELQAEAEAEGGLGQGTQSEADFRNMDPETRVALVRSASFSAIAAAAGWIKAQHWLMDADNYLIGLAPMPPDSICCWEAAEAWLTDRATWQGLSSSVLRHDAMLYRTLLLEIVQSPALCPLGALSFLEQYTRRYIGELPGDALPPQQVGAALLAICQASVMAHLFDPGCRACNGWTEEQADIAQAVQLLLAVLSTAFPVAQTRHKAGAFLQHLAAATSAQGAGDASGLPGGNREGGWQLVRQLLGSYLSEAISGGSPSNSPV